MILEEEVQEIIFAGEIIEDYPEDVRFAHRRLRLTVRGHSCLMSGKTSAGRIVHVVCAPKVDYLAIISAYLPSPDKWEVDLRTRRR